MTERTGQTKPPAYTQGLTICAVAFLFALFLGRNETATSCLRRGLSLCAETVIPSLFPFFVLSSLVIETGVGEHLGRMLARPMARLFGISGGSVTPLLLGAICGFPIGARTAAALYDRGHIDRDELEYLLSFCNNCGAGFVIGTVGGALWSSPAFGIALYLIQLGAAMLIGLCTRRHAAPSFSAPSHQTTSLTVSLTHAITDAARSMLGVCGYVLFFSALLGSIGRILDVFSPAPLLDALLFCTFELSSGVSAASSLEPMTRGAILTAFTVGWSGISVHLQVMAMTDGRGLCYRRYISAKLIQGLLCAAITAIWLLITQPELVPDRAADAFAPMSGGYLIGANSAFAVGLVCSLFAQIRKKFGKIR